MADARNHPRYVVISPVKDEERYVESTLRSIVAQTVRPLRWVIVDDGSTDRTPELVQQYAHEHSWIQVLRRETKAARQPGSLVMHAFYHGLEAAKDLPFDFVVKLDCDVELTADYFERILERFQLDPRLGIASGVYLEVGPAGWEPIPMPSYHACGASKVMRAQCFEEIGGFVCERGWDTVDEIRAQVRGWTTRHFEDLQFRHLKVEGSGIGDVRTNVMHGEVYYVTGGGPLFLLIKVLHRMVTGTPLLVGGLALLWGYLRLRLANREMLLNATEARYYRKLLNRRIWRWLAKVVGMRPKAQAWGLS